MLSGESAHAMEHTSRTGRWLRERRTRFALWIAAIESIVVAVAVFAVVALFFVFTDRR